MNTFLFDKIIYGPVNSRRLGISLGINLLPIYRKYCNFDCAYCECGLNKEESGEKIVLPSRREVSEKLKEVLRTKYEKNERIDGITFAGNGEPTMHPEFNQIIDDVILLRDQYYKDTAITVLSNSTMLHKRKVVEALNRVDQKILKLDSGILKTIQLINRPVGSFDLKKMQRQLKNFSGKLIIQTMFMKGFIEGQPVNNTTEVELTAWEAAISEIKPDKVMIYSIDRNTPFDTLEKIPVSKLQWIAARIKKLGFPVQVSG